MKMRLSFSLLLLAQSLACCLCVGDDGSARRYANVMENDELFLTFCLLERDDVQRELKMTPEQIAKIRDIRLATAAEIPGFMDLLSKNRKRQSEPTLSASDKEKLRKAATSELTSLIEAYQRKGLSATLSVDQRQRLSELLAQMRGPVDILNNPAISSKLQLSEKQRAEMADTVKHYEAGLGWLRARYGRQQISGLHKSTNETLEDRQKELEALHTVIRAIEKERDADLLLELTPDQLASWSAIQGRLFPIAWPQTSVSDSFFREQK
jgi:hypothetical protein